VSRWRTAALVGAAYLALSQYVIWLNDPVHQGAGYWPAAGVTLAALLLIPTADWALVLGAVAAAEIGGDAVHGYPFVASAWWAAGNVIEPLLAASLLRRFARSGRLMPVRDLGWFLVAGVVVAPLAGALVGHIGTTGEYGTARVDVILKWWAGDGLGVLVFAPLLLSFREPAVPGRSRAESIALPVIVVAFTVLAFRNWDPQWDVVLPYIVLPLMMWVSVRLGIRGAAIAGFAVAEVANVSTALGYGAFTLVAAPDGHAVTVLQVFLASALTAGLLIATLVDDALERTRQLERQRSVTDALQAAVLPRHLPCVPGVALAARYVPASPDPNVRVGGDWYDAFALADGSLGFVLGDVAGHDTEAAVAMGQLRNGLRSLLFELGDPALAMAALDRQLAVAGGRHATAICAVYDRGRLAWSNAGHPPWLHVPEAGDPCYLAEHDTDPPLGLGLGLRAYRTHRATMAGGDLVIGFTDGLFEHRTWSLDEGLTHVAKLVANAAQRDPESLCELLVRDGLDGRAREDDTCVVALGID
jgi:serine phosphatase RsbU (regulator of sigma subunit)